MPFEGKIKELRRIAKSASEKQKTQAKKDHEQIKKELLVHMQEFDKLFPTPDPNTKAFETFLQVKYDYKY